MKENTIKRDIFINKNKIFKLIGIGKGVTKTLGEIEISIKGEPVKFQLVPENFKIRQKGILGVEFLRSQEATLKFKRNASGGLLLGGVNIPFENRTTIRLPARQKTLVTLPIKGDNQKSGYLPKIRVGPGIFLGEALVTPENGYIKVFAINTTSENTEITLPPTQLEEFDIIKPEKNRPNKDNPPLETKEARAKRMCDIARLLKLDGLNEEEKSSLL